MDSIIPEFPEIKFLRPIGLTPILNLIDTNDEEILNNIRTCNKKVAKLIINEYGINNIKKMDFLFKKYKDNYIILREELQKFIEERKLYLEIATSHLK
jgi:hypothetical protein